METQQSVGQTGIGTFLSFGAKNVQPDILEKMLVGRQKTVDLLEKYARDIAQNGVNHQVFVVGPRGSGKTHMLRVLYFRIADLLQRKDIIVAYFAEEEYGISGYLDFLIRILNAFMRWYDADRTVLEAQLNILRETPESRQEYVAERIITEYVGDKPLLILSENFDTILEALNKQGQSKLRAWLYRHNRISIIATSQATSPDMGREDRPFYGFFSTITLKKLTYEESLKLLQNLAQIEENLTMIEHLAGKGQAQVRAIHELIKGNHRLLVTFYEFLKANSLADLSAIFMKTMNDLKPYYETFIRFLPAQQQKILHYLAMSKIPQKGTDIAKNCFIATTSLTKQLSELQRQHLIDALTDPTDKRNKLYDVSEPLLRIAIEIGEQREGITALFIDFLALYYSHEEIKNQKARFEDLYQNETEPLKKQKFYWEVEARDQALKLKAELDKMQEDLSNKAKKLLSAGVSYGKKGDYKQAVKALRETIKVDPVNALAWSNLGNAYAEQGAYNNAVDMYRQAISIRPDEASIWYNLGITYFEQNNHNEAVKSFKQAVHIKSNYASAWYNIGASYFLQGDYKQSIEAYQIAGEISPNDASIWFNLGIAYSGQKEYIQAIESSQKAVELQPDHASAWYNIGFYYHTLKEYKRAIDAYQRAIQLNPDNMPTWYNLGGIYFTRGEYDHSINAFQKAVEILPKNEESIKGLESSIIKRLQNQSVTEPELTRLEAWLQSHERFEIISSYVTTYRRVVFSKEEKALYELPKEQRMFFEREILKRSVE